MDSEPPEVKRYLEIEGGTVRVRVITVVIFAR